MDKLDQRIAALSDRQAVSVLTSLAGEFVEPGMPQGREEEATVLEAFFTQEGEPVALSQISDEPTPETGEAARRFLVLLAEVPQVQQSLVAWLEHPPTQEQAGIPLLLAAPLVLTGCIMTLHFVCGTRFGYVPGTGWYFDYDGTKPREQAKSYVKAVANVMRSLIPTANRPGSGTDKGGEPGRTEK